MDEDQSTVHRRQPIIDDDVYPGAVLPDVEVEDAGVVLDEQVVLGNDVGEQVCVPRSAQRRSSSQEPTVTFDHQQQQQQDQGEDAENRCSERNANSGADQITFSAETEVGPIYKSTSKFKLFFVCFSFFVCLFFCVYTYFCFWLCVLD